MTEVADKIAALQDFGDAVCLKIKQIIAKLAFPESIDIKEPVFSEAEFSLVTDPYTQTKDLVGFCYSAGKMRVGQIRFNSEGGVYAEFDVVQPHPTKKHLFVEAVHAWGKPDNIKAEAKLLEIPQ